MAYSEEEKRAFHQRCKNNYQHYNHRIKQLEEKGSQNSDAFKLIPEIIQIQKELTEKTEARNFKIDLFWKKENSTRDQFLGRLNQLFANATKSNKNRLRNLIQELDGEVAHGQGNFERLQLLNQLLGAVPFTDKDRVELKKGTDSLWEKWKARRNDPEIEKRIDGLKTLLKAAKQQMQGIADMPLVVPSFKDNWDKMIAIHKGLKAVQSAVTEVQRFVATRPLDQSQKNQFFDRINKVWQDTQRCWNNNGLSRLSTWVEEVTASNFQYFDSQLQQVEEECEGQINRQKVQSLQQKIKNIIEAMKEKDSQGKPMYPLKWTATEELFGRVHSLRAHLQAVWDQARPVTSREFLQLKDHIDKALKRLLEASSIDAMYAEINLCKELHTRRKDFLNNGKISAPENGRLRKMIDHLWTEAYNLKHIARPEKFSIEWLAKAYAENLQRGWVVFVDDVPAIR